MLNIYLKYTYLKHNLPMNSILRYLFILFILLHFPGGHMVSCTHKYNEEKRDEYLK